MSQTKLIAKRSSKKTTKSEVAKTRASSSGKAKPVNGSVVTKKIRKGSKRQGETEPPPASQTNLQEPSSGQTHTTAKETGESPEVARPPERDTQTAEYVVTVDRRRLPDRRSGEDRRQQNIPVAVERRQLDRRAKVPRRRQIDPTTCERDYTPDEIEFMIALDEYKRSSGRMFPTCSEILEVIKKLGYEKRPKPATEDPQESAPSEGSQAGTPPADATTPSEPLPTAAGAVASQSAPVGTTAASEGVVSAPTSGMPLSGVR